MEHQIAGTSKEALLEDIRTIIEKCTFSYTRQVEIKGPGHAILTGENLIGDNPFGVIFTDDLCINNGAASVMKQMVELYDRHQCSIIAIEEVPLENISDYGVIEGDEIEEGLFRVTNMVEKPLPEDAPTNLAIIGRYILMPDIFQFLRDTPPGANGEIQITDAINQQAQEDRVLAYRFEGRRFDCGSLTGFVAATNFVFDQVIDGTSSFGKL